MNKQLDYASPAQRIRKPPVRLLCLILLTFTALALFTAVYIEVLNGRAGSYLPRDFATDPGKWRTSTASIAHKLAMARVVASDPTLSSRAPTAADALLIDRQERQILAREDLHQAVESFGLLQYPVTFALLLALPLAAFLHNSKRWRIVLSVALLFNIACMTLMFYRGYFTSLGW